MTPVYRDVTWVLTQTRMRMSASVVSGNSKLVVEAHDPLLRRWQVEHLLLCCVLDSAETGTARMMTWMGLGGALRGHHHHPPRRRLLRCLHLCFPHLHHRSCS